MRSVEQRRVGNDAKNRNRRTKMRPQVRRWRRRSGGRRRLFLIMVLIIIAIAAAVVLRGCRNDEGEVNEPGDVNTSNGATTDNGIGYNSYVNNDEVETLEQYERIVWLDAGHGGIYGGAHGVGDPGTYTWLNDQRIYEKDIALDIVLMVYEMFRHSNSGIKVMLTRSEDVYVYRFDRPDLWNDSADLVVSVHINYYDGPTASTVSGIEVHFDGTSDENTGRVNITNEQFAQIMQDNLVAETGARNRGTRGQYNWIITRRSTMPVALIEAGFMSNQEELALLVTPEYQMKIATAIYNGIVEAFGAR